MDSQASVEKRCAKCGRVALVRPRERRCKSTVGQSGFKNRYWCYGKLARVARPKRAAKPKPTTTPVVDVSPRAEILPDLSAALDRVDYWVGQVANATKKLVEWQRTVARLSKRAAMTAEEIAAERDRAKRAVETRRRARRRRGIELQSDEKENA